MKKEIDNERLQLEELLMTCSKSQMIEKYIDELEENSKLSELWCKSQEENKELKKQIEEYKDKIDWYENFEVNKTIDKLRIKQKKFIDYLEYQVKLQEEINDIHLATGFEEILSKYKEINSEDTVHN